MTDAMKQTPGCQKYLQWECLIWSRGLRKASLQKECLNWDLMDEWELNLRSGKGAHQTERTTYAKGLGTVEGTVFEKLKASPHCWSPGGEPEGVGMRWDWWGQQWPNNWSPCPYPESNGKSLKGRSETGGVGGGAFILFWFYLLIVVGKISRRQPKLDAEWLAEG